MFRISSIFIIPDVTSSRFKCSITLFVKLWLIISASSQIVISRPFDLDITYGGLFLGRDASHSCDGVRHMDVHSGKKKSACMIASAGDIL